MSFEVIEPGLFTLVVDQGRPSSRSLGVPVGGAADQFSLAIGNALVGNPPGTPALELSLVGPTLRAANEVAMVVFGAPFTLRTGQPEQVGRVFTVRKGDIIRIQSTPHQMRAYLCVPGGFTRRTYLGSCSAFEPIRPEEMLVCPPSHLPSRQIKARWHWNEEPTTLRVLAGSQAGWFQTDRFYGQLWRVTPSSNRMGLRLNGSPLSVPSREMVSEPVAPGTVQVTRDGQCILLGVDGQTIGGYPKIAHVISADLDKLGQLRAGDEIRFREVDLNTASQAYHEKRRELREWLTRLRVSPQSLIV